MQRLHLLRDRAGVVLYERELRSYFGSPFFYGIAGAFWLLAGFFFNVQLQSLLSQLAAFDQQGGATITQPIDAPYLLIQNFMGVLGFLLLLLLPMLSMGLYTEERKRTTLELLLTAPVRNWTVAIAKLLAVLTAVVGLLLPIALYEAIALGSSSPLLSPWIFFSGYVGLLLLAAAILSLGMFLSSLTDSTVLAAILSFLLVLALWALDSLGGSVSGAIGDISRHLSLLQQYSQWVEGQVSSASVILFASAIGLGLFLTAQSVELLRVRRG
ncbi:ABC transporter permease [Synechococcus elongatus]|uniref:ABC transporter permease n=1 Tax=Synechococcus elongatus TaxID=32046 RepID=UPI000F7E1046|nr:ABC transporter permease subunit [Synechococcus elongatus]